MRGTCLVLCFGLIGAGFPAAEGKDEKPIKTGTSEELKKLFDDLVAAAKADKKDDFSALSKTLELPNHADWFKKTFGDEQGAKVAEEYAKQLKELNWHKLIAERIKEKQTEVSVVAVDNPDDKNATGNQKRALQNMKQKMTLYTVRLAEPGKQAGFTLHSFIYVDGAFRLLGKMKALK